MFYTLLWTLTMLCGCCLADEDAVARIFTSSPIIERGSTLEVFCSLGKKLLSYKNASHVIWKLDNSPILKENCIIINDSISKVIIHNFTYEKAQVKCFVDSLAGMQHMAHAVITSGFPPQAPEHISCILYYGKNLTCNWTSTRETHTETNYTLTIYKMLTSSSRFSRHCFLRSIASSGSCSIQFANIGYSHDTFNVTMTAKNPLGEVVSKHFPQNILEIVKIGSPQINKIETIRGKKQMLQVTWTRTEAPRYDHLKCQIRYKATTKNHSGEVSDHMGNNKQTKSRQLDNLWDFTNYSVAIQCAVNESRYWSEWSSEQIGTTEEQAPLKVDLWRVIESNQASGDRIVHFLWKKREEFPSSGVIQSYTIKYFNRSFEHNVTTTNKGVSLNLTGEAYTISVVAHNAAGESSEALLRIPSIHEVGYSQGIDMLNASNINDTMVVEWKTSDLEVTDYVIEWYDAEMKRDYVFERSWQNIRNVTQWTAPKGTFLPGICYNISVYPLHQGEIKTPRSIETYFRELPPLVGPEVEKVVSVDKNEATIKWREIPKEQARGYIKYTVFYRPEGGEVKEQAVNANELHVRLTSLQPSVKYTAYVVANNTAGTARSTEINFVTNPLSVLDIVIITVSVGIFMLCLLTVGLLWALKRHMLKSICWPEIPRPTVSVYPEISEQKVMLRKPPCEDDTIPPDVISMLKVDEEEEEVQLQKPGSCFKKTNMITGDMVGRHGISSRTNCKDNTPVPEPKSFVEQDFRNQPLPALKAISKDYENVEVPDQASLKENMEFNPYLKNSVPARDFLIFKSSSGYDAKETQIQTILLEPCSPNGAGQPYVALDTFELFSKHC